MKTKTKKTTPKPRVTSVSVSRLYNLGNYQNVKYDLAAEVPKGASAAETLVSLSRILEALRPIRPPDCAGQLEDALKKSEADRSSWEKDHLQEWIHENDKHAAKLRRRGEAILSLDSLGGTLTFKDNSRDWED